MTYTLSEQQFHTVMNLPANERYQHFVKKVTQWGEIWSLADADGWVSLRADDEECFPVWPHPEYAAAWATGDWAGCKPKAIGLEVWLERWIKGLESDGSMVAVFPNEDEEGIVVAPAEIGESLLEELESE